MKYSKLGNTNIEVSKLCLGCMSFGDSSSNFHSWTLNEKDTEEVIARALELGFNFFDTANVYSGGTSELYLAKALKNLNVPRDKVVLASKVYFNEGHLSKEAIHREIEGTLNRLGTSYLDLYIIHRFDYGTPIEETMEALDELVKEGKVRSLGASAMYGYQFHNMQIVAKERGFTPFISMQNHYNPFYREDERELIPLCKQMNVALTPYSPLAAGRAARANWKEKTLRSETDQTAVSKYDSTEQQDKLIAKRIEELANKYQTSMTAITLAWHFAKGMTSPIIGATKLKYLDDAVRAFDVTLSDEDVAYLDELYLPHKIVGAL